MKTFGIVISGLFLFVLAFGDDTAPSSGAWKDKGYSSYSECKNSPEVALITAQKMTELHATPANQIKHILCN